MKLTTSSVVPAPRDRVFAAITDPEVLRRAIPGCELLTETAPDSYQAAIKVGVAGLTGTYAGKAAIRDRNPPESLTLTFEGKGGPGFVRGSAAIGLAVEGEAMTRVSCDADVQVGGIIAAVGSRLIEAAARKLAEDFFRNLSGQLQPQTM